MRGAGSPVGQAGCEEGRGEGKGPGDRRSFSMDETMTMAEDPCCERVSSSCAVHLRVFERVLEASRWGRAHT